MALTATSPISPFPRGIFHRPSLNFFLLCVAHHLNLNWIKLKGHKIILRLFKQYLNGGLAFDSAGKLHGKINHESAFKNLKKFSEIVCIHWNILWKFHWFWTIIKWAGIFQSWRPIAREFRPPPTQRPKSPRISFSKNLKKISIKVDNMIHLYCKFQIIQCICQRVVIFSSWASLRCDRETGNAISIPLGQLKSKSSHQPLVADC